MTRFQQRKSRLHNADFCADVGRRRSLHRVNSIRCESPPPFGAAASMSARRLDAQLQEAALARHGAARQALEAQIQRTLQSDRSVAEKTFHAVMKELDAILPLAAKPILEAAAVRKQCTPKQIQEMAKKVTAAPPIIADGAAADVRAFAARSARRSTSRRACGARRRRRPRARSRNRTPAWRRRSATCARRRRGGAPSRAASPTPAPPSRSACGATLRASRRARSVRREPAPLKRRDESALTGARRSLRADLESLRKATAASTTALDRDAKGAADASAAAAALADEAIQTHEADSQARWAAEALQAVELLLQQLPREADAAEEDRQARALDAGRGAGKNRCSGHHGRGAGGAAARHRRPRGAQAAVRRALGAVGARGGDRAARKLRENQFYSSLSRQPNQPTLPSLEFLTRASAGASAPRSALRRLHVRRAVAVALDARALRRRRPPSDLVENGGPRAPTRAERPASFGTPTVTWTIATAATAATTMPATSPASGPSAVARRRAELRRRKGGHAASSRRAVELEGAA